MFSIRLDVIWFFSSQDAECSVIRVMMLLRVRLLPQFLARGRNIVDVFSLFGLCQATRRNAVPAGLTEVIGLGWTGGAEAGKK